MPGDGLLWQDGKSLWGTELTKAVLNSSVPMDRLAEGRGLASRHGVSSVDWGR